jgi:aminoglycoside phosphotransferase family enzyme/predicted kinase
MTVESQAPAIAFIEALPAGPVPVETMQTHISRIFLVGDRVYKMKRAVKLPYADFSTPELRLDACLKEVELNSRTAPGLYLGVRRLTREKDGVITFDGAGDLVDAVVEMKRFDQDALFDKIALAGHLTPKLATDVAEMIAAFHRAAPVVHSGGGAANIAGVLDINEAGFGTSHVFGAKEIADFNHAFRIALDGHAALLDRREADGKVRRCHGDLHLRNICLLDGQPRLFDCIEFNDQIATIDTLYDLAFLLMDLWHRGLEDIANLVANRYFDLSDDENGFVLLPFFMALRAAVRAHVTATQAEGGDPRGKLSAEARSYFDLARLLLLQSPPCLVVIGGLSGTGKTTIAEALACRVGTPPGARIVESDRIRKAMHGVSIETRLPESAYRPEISDRVYEEMARRVGEITHGGGSVVADAVFDKPEKRDLMEKTARRSGARFDGIWLKAEPTLLKRRIETRRGGPSDATLDILAQQLARDVGEITWQKIDAGGTADEIVDRVLTDGLKSLRDPWRRVSEA